MIIERIQRPNHQPIRQESRAKLAKQAANDSRDPNLYGPNARQGRGPVERRATVNPGPLVGLLLYLLGWPGVVVVVGGGAALWRWLA